MLLDNSAFNNCLAENTTEGHIYQEELRDIIAQSIDQLNENERAVISLYYFEELKLKDIARILGYPVEGIPNPRKSTYENEIKTEKNISRTRGDTMYTGFLFCGGGAYCQQQGCGCCGE